MPLCDPRTPVLRQPFEAVESDEPRGIASEVPTPPSHALALSYAELKVERLRGVNVTKSIGVQILPCSKNSRARGTWLADQPLAQFYIPKDRAEVGQRAGREPTADRNKTAPDEGLRRFHRPTLYGRPGERIRFCDADSRFSL
jgi:hypothetical protein